MNFMLALVLCAVGEIAAAGENLVVNPGFDDGTDSQQRWHFNARNTDSEIAWDNTVGRSGSSARIANRTKAESGNVVQSVRIDPPLEPGSRVTFSAMVATKDLTRSGPRIIVYLQQPSGDRQTATAAGTAGTHEFTEIRGEARVWQQVSRVVVYLCNYGTGTVWWDDASVTVDRAAAREVVYRPETDKQLPTLETVDGLGLTLSTSGGVGSVLFDGHRLPNREVSSGLWIVPFDGDPLPVTGRLTADDGSVVQRFEDADAGLAVEATFTAGEKTIRCDGFVADRTGRDRGLDLLFSLPLGGDGWRWGKNIREEVAVSGADNEHVVDETTFSALSNPASGTGIALAVPADAPSDCRFTLGGRFGYAVRYRFGLSPAADGPLKQRAPFSFVIYLCDGRWGLRDAAQRYYCLWPEAFRKRVAREGLWLFGRPKFPLPDPENYTFHEGGPSGWEQDDAAGIYTCPYIIPGQREITRLETLPETKQEALEIFKSSHLAPGEDSSDMPGQSLVPAEALTARSARGWGPSMRQIIENCMLLDADGLPHVLIRNSTWGGNSITFPLNGSPRLAADSDEPTVAKVLLDYAAKLHDDTPGLDGIYVDSLGSWGNYLNYRRDHFVSSSVPLSYDPENGRPVLPNRFTLLEFIQGLGDEMHDRGKLIFANGVHHNRRFHFFALDVMGVEGHGRLEQKRTMAFQKPFLLLVYNIHNDPAAMEHHYNLCTFYGIFPSFANMRVYETPEMYAPVAALNRRFVPALRAIAAAGWQPITHARTSNTAVWLERWGPDPAGNLFFSVYNSSAEELTAELTIDAAALGLVGKTIGLADQLSDFATIATIEEDTASISLDVPGERIRVLRVSVE